ncbi:hypothetical protein ACUY29_04330 [Corynebacterium aurimucosum]
MNSHRAAVKIRNRSSYCSGVLIDASLGPRTQQATRLVLTCAHFSAAALTEGITTR